MPTSTSILSFGAVGDGVTNNDQAFAAASASGNDIYIPAGDYLYSSAFTVPAGATWEGDGFASNLIADTNNDGAIFVTGKGTRLRNLRRTYTGGGPRQSRAEAHAIAAFSAEDFEISGVHVEGSSAVGIILYASVRGKVFNNVVADTLADGIHTTGASRFVEIFGNHTLNTGDDCISVVSYVVDGTPCEFVSIFGNQTDGGLARGITVVGGSRILVSDNVIRKPKSQAILVNSDETFGTYGGEGVDVHDNLIVHTGILEGDSQPAIVIGGRSDYIYRDVTLRDNMLYDSPQRGVAILGNSENIKIEGNLISRTNGIGISAQDVKDLTIRANVLRSTAEYGISTLYGTGRLRIVDNDLTDINTSGTSYMDVIQINGGTALERLEVSNNHHSNPDGNTFERFVECFSNGAIAENNFGPGDVALGSPPYSEVQRVKAAARPWSTATTVSDVVNDFNALLADLKDHGLVAR